MLRDYTSTIRQLNQARQNCLDGIASTEAASTKDGVDRTGAIGSMTRDLASYDRQLAEIERLTAPEPKPLMPEATVISEEVIPEFNPTE